MFDPYKKIKDYTIEDDVSNYKRINDGYSIYTNSIVTDGFQLWIDLHNGIWYIGNYRHGREIGYEFCNDIGVESLTGPSSEVCFYIV